MAQQTDATNGAESVTNMSADEMDDLVNEMDAEQQAVQDLCDELEQMEFVTDADDTLVTQPADAGKGQWREISVQYELDNGMSKAMPIDLVRWATSNDLAPRSNYPMPEQENKWGASFVVEQSL
jgi:DNA-binding protein YbaB